jgi:hypothetical protein
MAAEMAALPAAGDWYPTGHSILEESRLVKIGTPEHGRMLPDLDLIRLARSGFNG